jgi:hypothetical protein
MKDIGTWFDIITNYAVDTGKPVLTALNEVYQSDDEMTDEQFDELEKMFTDSVEEV